MRCNEIEELLSACANDEATGEEQKIVEQHLAGCKDCREKLESLREVRQKLATLREAPAPAMTADAVSAILTKGNHTSPFHSWKARAFAAVPLVVIIVLLAVLQPWSSPLGPDAVLAKAHDAITEVSSYRYSMTATVNGTYKEKYYMEFTEPGRAYIREDIDGSMREYIVIGDDQYYLGDFPSPSHVLSQIHIFSLWISREFALDMFDKMSGVRELGTEKIEGTECIHYTGLYDYEKVIRSQQRSHPLSEEQVQQELEMYREQMGDRYIDMWIGKEDYLLRQMTTESNSVISTYKYYDFNEPIAVEPPLDENGELLAGWYSLVPDEPVFSFDFETSIDSRDPANQMLSYVVTITNTGKEEVRFRVRNLPMMNAQVWNRKDQDVSNYLRPGDSTTYGMTFGFNRTESDIAQIAAVIEKAGFIVTYETPEGEQKTETVHFPVPDDFYVTPTDMMTLFELERVNEYAVTEPGITFVPSHLHGEINGRHYLFLVTEKRTNEEAGPAGLLVLDIEDRDNPVQVAYLEAPNDEPYLMWMALAGDMLYVPTEEYLWILDVSDPANPRELARFSGVKPRTLIVSGSYAYVNDNAQRITALDVSDPSSPRVVGSIELATRSAVNFDLAGDHLLAESGDTVHIIDISSPESLYIVDSLTFTMPDGTPAHPNNPLLQDEFYYLTLSDSQRSGLLVMDVSNPAAPQEIGFLEVPGQAIFGPLHVHEDYAYFIGMSRTGLDRSTRLNVVDVSDPTNPVMLGYATLPEFWSFFETFDGGGSSSFGFVDTYAYWIISSRPNQPLVEIFDLAGLTD